VNRVSDWQTIDVSVDGLVAWLRFNRPERHNAVSPAASFDRDVQARVAELAARQPGALRQMKANFLEAERLPLQEFIKAEAQRHFAAFSGGSGAQARGRLAEQGKRIRDSGSQ
jgi:enoyl-CoA hydratase/carnithine racemase